MVQAPQKFMKSLALPNTASASAKSYRLRVLPLLEALHRRAKLPKVRGPKNLAVGRPHSSILPKRSAADGRSPRAPPRPIRRRTRRSAVFGDSSQTERAPSARTRGVGTWGKTHRRQRVRRASVHTYCSTPFDDTPFQGTFDSRQTKAVSPTLRIGDPVSRSSLRADLNNPAAFRVEGCPNGPL
jgi:hypothetical protein